MDVWVKFWVYKITAFAYLIKSSLWNRQITQKYNFQMAPTFCSPVEMNEWKHQISWLVHDGLCKPVWGCVEVACSILHPVQGWQNSHSHSAFKKKSKNYSAAGLKRNVYRLFNEKKCKNDPVALVLIVWIQEMNLEKVAHELPAGYDLAAISSF